MRKRTVSSHKKEIHLTILVDAESEDFEETTLKIRTEVMNHNRRPENERKVSYDIIHAKSPRGHRPKHRFAEEREITWGIPVKRKEAEQKGEKDGRK